MAVLDRDVLGHLPRRVHQRERAQVVCILILGIVAVIEQVFPAILRSKMLGVLYVVMILNTSIFVATAHRSIFHAWMTGFLSWVVRLSHGVTYRIPVWSEQRFAG